MDKPATPRIIVFNNLKRCTGVFHSAYAAARSIGGVAASIKSACSGETVTYRKQYFRYIPGNIEVTLEDLGTLTLKEFDSLCGVEKRFWITGKLSEDRKNEKYKDELKQQRQREKEKKRLNKQRRHEN